MSDTKTTNAFIKKVVEEGLIGKSWSTEPPYSLFVTGKLKFDFFNNKVTLIDLDGVECFYWDIEPSWREIEEITMEDITVLLPFEVTK